MLIKVRTVKFYMNDTIHIINTYPSKKYCLKNKKKNIKRR